MSKPNITIGFVQINSSFAEQDYFPLAVGLLQAYLQKYGKQADFYNFLEPAYRREPPAKIAGRLARADIVGCSIYVWNQNISLDVARRLKELNPRILIVFGGPQVPNRADAFLRRYPFVDLVCHGEGEQVFAGIVARWPERDWTGIQSISYRDARGTFQSHPRISRIADLSVVPSPYLSGVFDRMTGPSSKHKWLGLWETNRGCPFQCAFCEWGNSAFNRVYCFDIDRLRAEIRWFTEHHIEFIFCCDANFGLFQRDLKIAELVADAKRQYGYPHAFSVQSSKNAPGRIFRIQKLLNDHQISKGVLLALQSVSPIVLNNVRRQNIPMATFDELQKRFQREGILTFTDMIIGLPGETYESFVDGVDQIISNGQHNRIQFINLSILGNSAMGAPDYQRRYGMEIIRSQIINIHGVSSEEAGDEIPEMQDLVVATSAMPKEDWVRARVFSWMTSLVYFDKLLQIPLALLHKYCGLRYRQLLECFMDFKSGDYPLLGEIRAFFEEMARSIQSGGPEYCRSREWLDIWWPADEYMMIKLCVQGNLDKFYNEADQLLSKLALLERRKAPFLRDALRLNWTALMQFNPRPDPVVKLHYNVWELYRAAVEGRDQAVQTGIFSYSVDRSENKWQTVPDWCQQVVWYQNKKGAYLNPVVSVKSKLS